MIVIILMTVNKIDGSQINSCVLLLNNGYSEVGLQLSLQLSLIRVVAPQVL